MRKTVALALADLFRRAVDNLLPVPYIKVAATKSAAATFSATRFLLMAKNLEAKVAG